MDFALLDIATVIYPEYNELLGISYPDLNNTYAANCVGLAFGCVFFIPLALKYGRRPIYLASTLALFLSAIWLALLSTYSQLLAVNILNGLAGATSETLIQMTVREQHIPTLQKRLLFS
jgi:MFS family permease